jgi:F-type H+-transporting ATPase subunit gamma
MVELERAKRRIRNTTELQSVVKIMKAISSVNIQEYEMSLRSLSEYNKTIELGLQIILQNNNNLLTPKKLDENGSLGAVVFGSEQGLCGKFNDIVSSYALDRMAKMQHEDRRVLAVGGRVFARLENAGQSVEAYFSFSGDFLGITEVMGKVLAKIDQWRLESNVNKIVLFYNRPINSIVGSFSPQMADLFPIDARWFAGLAEKKWHSNSMPTYSMDTEVLFSSLVREHLFFTLYRAFAESLASENSSRLASMQLAEKNIEEHLSELLAHYRKQRQDAISSELLDILTGYEALASE